MTAGEQRLFEWRPRAYVAAWTGSPNGWTTDLEKGGPSWVKSVPGPKRLRDRENSPESLKACEGCDRHLSQRGGHRLKLFCWKGIMARWCVAFICALLLSDACAETKSNSRSHGPSTSQHSHGCHDFTYRQKNAPTRPEPCHSVMEWILFPHDLMHLAARQYFGAKPERPRPFEPATYLPPTGYPPAGSRPTPSYTEGSSYRPSQPSFQPSQPTQPSEPIYQPSRPTYTPSQPSYPTQPSYEPSQPTQPSYQPSQPTQPSYQPSQPPYQPSQPSQPPYQPSQPPYQPSQPPYQPSQPSQPPYQPSQPSQPPYQPSPTPQVPNTQPPYVPETPGQETNPPINPALPDDDRHPPHIHAITVDCGKEMMTINIEFNKVYNGIIYSQDHFGEPECVYVKENSNKIKYSFTVNLNKCGTRFFSDFQNEGQAYLENVLVLQNEAGIQEVWDHIRRVRCLWEGNLTKQLFSSLSVGMLNQITSKFSGDTAMARLDIQIGRGPFAPEANGLVKIGEVMTLVVSVTGDPGFDIHVRECIARDDKSQHIVPLTDHEGCVLKPKLFGAFQKTRETGNTGASIIAYAFFNAFKFPDEMDLIIQCDVELCKTDCDVCPRPGSPEPRKRRRRDVIHVGNSTVPPSTTIMKGLRVILAEDLPPEPQGFCVSSTAAIWGGILVLIAALTSSAMASFLWQRSRGSAKLNMK
ncbi:DNA-directed RNA polymerase II subunit RPB1 [Eumeta japonica]|uniref:DNA-directed RNA polymerase II subunit RPB1 n=1 Tax=Eumeta variegata TaxID=151549 RepID=A0A4C1U3N0_EUMVA|nr:DNA-directed RNA polymerase II subunit RPB1 [Eumeta japonica]